MKKRFVIVGMIALFACNSEIKEKAHMADSLSKANAEMSKELSSKENLLKDNEAALNEFIKSFNEIQGNLNEIKSKEKIINTSYKGAELKKSDKDKIIGDIQLIYDLVGMNKQKVATLNKKLKDSNLKIEELDKAIENLTQQLADKETEIADLRNKLEKMNLDFTNLKMQYDEEKEASDMKSAKLNTAYFIVGEKKELIRKKVLTKEGGFIGIGKVAEPNSGFNEDDFIKIDITQTTEIPLYAKKVKLITTHPEDSYKLVGASGSVSKLQILDVDKFWKTSKYLIVVTD